MSNNKQIAAARKTVNSLTFGTPEWETAMQIVRNWDNVEFESSIAAVKSYARAIFGNGTLKKSANGTFLVY